MAKLVRRWMGPLAGRFVYRISSNSGHPVEIQGHRMLLAPPGGYPSPDMVADHYEQGTASLFKDLLDPGKVVVDVGAHVGFFTLLAAREVGPEGKVYAFEPESQNYALLLKNIELNGYCCVVATQKAVSNSSGITDLFLSSLDTGSHSIYSPAARGVAGSFKVATTSLDAFLEEAGWPHVDLVKIDVEGAELAVLDGMDRFLTTNGSVKLIVEYCPSLIKLAGSEPSELIDRLVSFGFAISVIDEKKGLVPLDAANQASLTLGLLRQESYCNLFCSK